MEKRMRALLLAIGVGVAAVVLISSLVDEGEVVTLVTHDANGAEYETPVWIVEIDGRRYLRAGGPGARWLERIRANPAVTIRPVGSDEDESVAMLAVPEDDAEKRETVNRLMAEKYGLADRFWSRILDRRKAVPIRLEPATHP
ncbi:hypothetical protein MYXO_00032 [Myxococcaceae bacterium]|jgi:hypothetical protein|nr:hypothetical protein MYXO_00032 [Myxococcaceae bacterium]